MENILHLQWKILKDDNTTSIQAGNRRSTTECCRVIPVEKTDTFKKDNLTIKLIPAWQLMSVKKK